MFYEFALKRFTWSFFRTTVDGAMLRFAILVLKFLCIGCWRLWSTELQVAKQKEGDADMPFNVEQAPHGQLVLLAKALPCNGAKIEATRLSGGTMWLYQESDLLTETWHDLWRQADPDGCDPDHQPSRAKVFAIALVRPTWRYCEIKNLTEKETQQYRYWLLRSCAEQARWFRDLMCWNIVELWQFNAGVDIPIPEQDYNKYYWRSKASTLIEDQVAEMLRGCVAPEWLQIRLNILQDVPNTIMMMPPPMAAVLPDWKFFCLWASGSVRHGFTLTKHGFEDDPIGSELVTFPQGDWDTVEVDHVPFFVHNLHAPNGLDSFQVCLEAFRDTASGSASKETTMTALSMMQQHIDSHHLGMVSLERGRRRHFPGHMIVSAFLLAMNATKVCTKTIKLIIQAVVYLLLPPYLQEATFKVHHSNAKFAVFTWIGHIATCQIPHRSGLVLDLAIQMAGVCHKTRCVIILRC